MSYSHVNFNFPNRKIIETFNPVQDMNDIFPGPVTDDVNQPKIKTTQIKKKYSDDTSSSATYDGPAPAPRQLEDKPDKIVEKETIIQYVDGSEDIEYMKGPLLKNTESIEKQTINNTQIKIIYLDRSTDNRDFIGPPPATFIKPKREKISEMTITLKYSDGSIYIKIYNKVPKDTTSANTTSANTTSANTTSANTTSANTTSANTTSANTTSANTTSANTTSAKISSFPFEVNIGDTILSCNIKKKENFADISYTSSKYHSALYPTPDIISIQSPETKLYNNMIDNTKKVVTSNQINQINPINETCTCDHSTHYISITLLTILLIVAIIYIIKHSKSVYKIY
jgi:hypothetical protein